MNKIQRGVIEAITAVVCGIVLTAVIDSFAKDGTLPKYFVLLFGLVNVIGNIVTINSFQTAGILYTLGWLGGSWLMISALSPVDIVFNIAAPAIILIARAYFGIKSHLST